MNVEVLKSAGIDYERGVKRFVGRAHLYEKALNKFTADTTFSRIRAAHEAGDAKALFAAAHEFKGMCGNIGLTDLYEAADEIVGLLRGGDYEPAALDGAYERMARKYRRAYDAVLAAREDAV